MAGSSDHYASEHWDAGTYGDVEFTVDIGNAQARARMSIKHQE